MMSLGFGALALTAQNALSQETTTCAPREIVLQKLSDRWGEIRQSVGLGRGNRIVEVFASGDTGTWTILATSPSGLSCVVAVGTAFEALSEPAGDPA
ncbi:hypothetical protein JM664_09900 [Rhodobacteraceae bacterium MCCB 386]|nr:hypothetical protein [Roseitranquillus sediminis]